MKTLVWMFLICTGIQFIPFGHSHTNPPVTKDLVWKSPQIQEIIHRACYDCHSNETVWPWYANVAPVSWLLQRDVNDGRRHLNFSEWDKPQEHSGDVAEQIKEGEMPPWFYLPMHSNARLSDADRQTLISGVGETLGLQSGPRRNRK
jgi:hypothetical protein